MGLLRIRSLLGDLAPNDAPLPDAKEVAVVVVICERVGELAIAGLEVGLELANLEDAKHLLHAVRGSTWPSLEPDSTSMPLKYWPM